MKKIIIAILGLALAQVAFAAPASESIKLSFYQIPALVAALGQLDGADRVVDQGKDKPAIVVKAPYDLSPATRRAIAHNVAALQEAFKAINDARLADLAKASPGAPEKVEKDPALIAKFTELFSKHDSLDVKIERLSEDELSANPIPPTLLVDLRPILTPSK